MFFNNNTMSPHTFLKSMMHIANAAVSGANASDNTVLNPVTIEEEDDDSSVQDVGELKPRPSMSRKKAKSMPHYPRGSHGHSRRPTPMMSDPAGYNRGRGTSGGLRSPRFSPRWFLNAFFPTTRQDEEHSVAASSRSSARSARGTQIGDMALSDPSLWMTWCAACVLLLAVAIFLSDVF